MKKFTLSSFLAFIFIIISFNATAASTLTWAGEPTRVEIDFDSTPIKSGSIFNSGSFDATDAIVLLINDAPLSSVISGFQKVWSLTGFLDGAYKKNKQTGSAQGVQKNGANNLNILPTVDYETQIPAFVWLSGAALLAFFGLSLRRKKSVS